MQTESSTTQKVSTRSVGVKFGLISALVGVVTFLIMVFTGQNAFDNSFNWKNILGMLISLAIIVLAHKSFKDNGNGYMSFGQGVGIAFWIALVSVVINLVFTYVYVTFIDPYAMDMMIQQQEQEMAARGMNDEQIEMAVGITKSVFWPAFLVMGILFGVLFGLIVSIFTQKKNPEPAF